MPTNYSLNPYQGPWTKEEAAHLLRRTTFGPNFLQIQQAITDGLESTVNALMLAPDIGEPLAYDDEESVVAQGEPWANATYPFDPVEAGLTFGARYRSVNAWLMERLNNQQDEISIVEKMCLFWQNHFGVASSGDARLSVYYLQTLHEHALGNFKQLVKDITIDPNMLEFLNGGTNSVQSPNENYARELLELYTIGKGPQIGPGDYTNYTETDISEGAKILTGYFIQGYRSPLLGTARASFNLGLHNRETKQLSGKFNNAIITDNGADEYADFIDIIFQQDEVARHICRKFYRYFVHHKISDEVENQIISGLATTLIDNNYTVQPVIEQLIKSEHFYDVSFRGCMIKSPLEMIFALWNGTESKPDYDIPTRYPMHLMNHWMTGSFGQSYTDPPSVAGWPAYYQEPAFYQQWLNAAYIGGRFSTIDWYTLYNGIQSNGESWSVDTLKFLSNLSNPSNARLVIEDMLTVFFPRGTTESQKDTLRLILTNGLPNFEWTIQYNEYIDEPDNPTFSEPIKTQLKRTLAALFKLPEFHTN